jgi:hypothetical protein
MRPQNLSDYVANWTMHSIAFYSGGTNVFFGRHHIFSKSAIHWICSRGHIVAKHFFNSCICRTQLLALFFSVSTVVSIPRHNSTTTCAPVSDLSYDPPTSSFAALQRFSNISITSSGNQSALL